jgi:hypothetical protein
MHLTAGVNAWAREKNQGDLFTTGPGNKDLSQIFRQAENQTYTNSSML